MSFLSRKLESLGYPSVKTSCTRRPVRSELYLVRFTAISAFPKFQFSCCSSLYKPEVDKNGKKTAVLQWESEAIVNVMIKWLVCGIRMITDYNKLFSCWRNHNLRTQRRKEQSNKYPMWMLRRWYLTDVNRPSLFSGHALTAKQVLPKRMQFLFTTYVSFFAARLKSDCQGCTCKK